MAAPLKTPDRPSSARNAARLTDTRSLRSQQALRNALVRLIGEKSLYSITMRDIAAAANLSYPTVFKHYPNREALFEDIARREMADFQDLVFFSEPASPVWRPGEQICAYVLERRVLWRSLLTAGAAEAMRSEFIRHGRELAGGRTDLSLRGPMDVVSGIIASGIFEILSWWLAQDARHPVADVARMLEELVLEPALNLAPGTLSGATTRP